MASRTRVVAPGPLPSDAAGCRVVTTSLTARVLLANQLRSLPEIDWTVVSGDRYRRPARRGGGRGHPHPPRVRPVRRRLLRPVVALPAAPAVRLRADPHPEGLVPRTPGGPAGRQPGHLHHPRSACTSRATAGWPTSWAGASNGGAARGPTGSWSRAARTNRPCPRSGSAAVASWRFVGNGIVMDRFLAPVAPALHVGPPHRDDGRPAGPGEGVRRLPGPGRVAVRAGPTSCMSARSSTTRATP